MKLERQLVKDGIVEIFKPHRYSDGCFRVEIRVPNEADLVDYAKQGCSIRMKSDQKGSINLVKPFKS